MFMQPRRNGTRSTLQTSDTLQPHRQRQFQADTVNGTLDMAHVMQDSSGVVKALVLTSMNAT